MRYNDVNYYKRFVVGITRKYMRLFDMDDIIQQEVANEPAQLTGPKPKLIQNGGDIIF